MLVDMFEFELCDLRESRFVESDPSEVWDFLEVDLEDLVLRKGILVLAAVDVVDEESCSIWEKVLIELLRLW